MVSVREQYLGEVAVAIKGSMGPVYATLGRGAVNLDSTSLEVLATELPYISRQPVDLASMFDVTNKREVVSQLLSFSASGGDVQFNRLILIARSSALAPIVFDGDAVDAVANEVSLPAHGLTTGQHVIFVQELGTTTWFGIAELTRYYVQVASPDAVRLFDETGSTQINLNAVAATDEYRLVVADGFILDVHEKPLTLIGDAASADVSYESSYQFGDWGGGL